MNIKIRVELDSETNQLMVYAPMSSQAEKDTSAKILAEAIKIIINQPLSVIIRPNGDPKLPTPPVPPLH